MFIRRVAFSVLILPFLGGAAPKDDSAPDAGRAIVQRHVDELEKEAKRLHLVDARAGGTVSRAAAALRTALAGEREPGSTALVPRVPKSAKVQQVTLDDFLAKHADGFPPAQNLARGGTVRASSSHEGMEDALTVLGGSRRRDVWALNIDEGQLELSWPKPVETRYVLLFNRPAAFGDHWLETSISVNGRAVAKVERFETGHVLILDLGDVFPVRSLKLDITGIARPGLAGIELHRRMLAAPAPAPGAAPTPPGRRAEPKR